MGVSLNQPSSVQDDGPMGCKLLLCFVLVWGVVPWSVKYKLFEKYSPKHLVVKEILYTFALAFTK